MRIICGRFRCCLHGAISQTRLLALFLDSFDGRLRDVFRHHVSSFVVIFPTDSPGAALQANARQGCPPQNPPSSAGHAGSPRVEGGRGKKDGASGCPRRGFRRLGALDPFRPGKILWPNFGKFADRPVSPRRCYATILSEPRNSVTTARRKSRNSAYRTVRFPRQILT